MFKRKILDDDIKNANTGEIHFSLVDFSAYRDSVIIGRRGSSVNRCSL